MAKLHARAQAVGARGVQPGEQGVQGLERGAVPKAGELDADRASDEGEHTAQITVHLEPDAMTAEIERAVRKKVERELRGIPDVLPPEFLPSTLFRFAVPLRIVFFGTGEQDLERLSRAAQQMANELRTFDGVENVRVGLGRGAREVGGRGRRPGQAPCSSGGVIRERSARPCTRSTIRPRSRSRFERTASSSAITRTDSKKASIGVRSPASCVSASA